MLKACYKQRGCEAPIGTINSHSTQLGQVAYSAHFHSGSFKCFAMQTDFLREVCISPPVKITWCRMVALGNIKIF